MTKRVKILSPRGMTPADKRIGEQIRTARLQAHITQDELAGKLGISFQQVQKYEKGTNRITAGRLAQLANALETSVNFLLGDAVNEHAPTNGQAVFNKFLASKDGVAIVEAMVAISRPSVRSKVIEVAKLLAG